MLTVFHYDLVLLAESQERFWCKWTGSLFVNAVNIYYKNASENITNYL